MVATLDEYVAAKERRDRARERLRGLSDKLGHVLYLLRDPEQVRVNEKTVTRVQRHIPYVLDESDLPTWGQVSEALRVFQAAEDDRLSAEASLSPEQRRHLQPE